MGGPFSGETIWRRSRRIVTLAAPAAGADWQTIVPGGHIYVVRGVLVSLVTAVAAANRLPRLLYSDGTTTFLDIAAASTQAASLTQGYTWWSDSHTYAVGQRDVMQIPEVHLPAGHTIGTTTDNLQAADQYGAVTLYVHDLTARWGEVNLDDLPDFLVGVVEGRPPGIPGV